MTRTQMMGRRRRRRGRTPRAFAGALVAASLVGSTAAAQPTTTIGNFSTEGRADVLFHSGEKKFDSGDYIGACADFSESLKLGPKLGTLLNLALCHATIGKTVTAWREFSHAAAWAAQNNQKDRLEFATSHVRALEPRLPRVVLQLPASRALESIDVDGEPLPEQSWYLPLFLDPGEHSLGATAPGKKRASITFRVISSPMEQFVLVPSLRDDVEHPALARTTADPTRKHVGIAALALGGVGIVVGTTFGAMAGWGAREDAGTNAAVATGAFLASAALLVTGGWLLWTSTLGSRSTARGFGAVSF